MSHLFHYFEKSFSPDINPLSAERPGSKRRYVPAASPTSAPAYGSATPPCLHITGGGYSVIGTRHLVNQDRCLVDPRRRVFMVADGMGGNRAGDRAAQMAIELLPYHPALIGCEHFDNQSIRREIAQAFLDVNREITMAGNLDSQSYGMGTTAVLALAVRDRLYVASLGDSRAYLFRDGDLHLYTVDHNMAQILVNMGAISRRRSHPPVAPHAVQVSRIRGSEGRTGRGRHSPGTWRSRCVGHGRRYRSPDTPRNGDRLELTPSGA